MSPSLVRASARHLARHPWLTALSLLGIALGVAVVVSVDLANSSALRAFERSTDALTGKATHQLVGGPRGIPDAVYARLRQAGISPAAPVVEGQLRSVKGGRLLTVLGVDPFAEEPFRPYAPRGGQRDLSLLLTRPDTALLAGPTARALGVGPGGTLEVEREGVRRTLTIVDLVEPSGSASAAALEGLVLMDLAAAQELLGSVGRLTRVDLIVTQTGVLSRVERLVPDGVELVRPRARQGTVDEMTRAFRTNLTALSLLALVVGMFLIYNTMTFSVVQRRGELGRLRALGVTRDELFALVLGEAALVGAVGTVGGVLGGILLGRGLVGLVTQTINDLYFTVAVRGLALEPLTFLKGVLLGLGATLAAAAFPAWEATRTPPAITLRRSSAEDVARRRAPGLALAGLGVLALGLLLLWWPTRELLPAYAGLFAVLLGTALLVPWTTRLLALALAVPLGRAFGLLGRVAARGVAQSLSRTAVALAALSVAVATTVGVGLMVGSFRETVVQWLDATLRADVYVSPPAMVFRRGGATFAPGVVERVRATPGAAAWSTVRVVKTRVDGKETDLIAVDPGTSPGRPYRLRAGDPGKAWPATDRGDDVLLVSEPFAFHRSVKVGDELQVATDRGERRFRVVGVYVDYGSDLGSVLMSRATYARHFDDPGVSGVALYAAPGTSPERLADAARTRVGEAQAVGVRVNRALREASLQVFDRTFTITHVLRLLSVAVAFVGVLSALMALQLERARELAVMRATGMTPGQLWGVVGLQTGVLGLLAGLYALPLGTALAAILVHVINRRSFGWTLELLLQPALLGQAVALALVAALLAGLYPAWRMARERPAFALREE